MVRSIDCLREQYVTTTSQENLPTSTPTFQLHWLCSANFRVADSIGRGKVLAVSQLRCAGLNKLVCFNVREANSDFGELWPIIWSNKNPSSPAPAR